MPLLIEEFIQLKEEMKLAKKGQLPPFMAFLISGGSIIVSFIGSFFFLFPWLRLYIGLNFMWSLVLSIAGFIVFAIILSELITLSIIRRPKK